MEHCHKLHYKNPLALLVILVMCFFPREILSDGNSANLIDNKTTVRISWDAYNVYFGLENGTEIY